MSLEGKLLGNRYEIIEKVGNGGMATVYKATDKVLKRHVAVKILRDEYTTDEEFIKRFEGEAQSAAKLSHHNIVSIFDVGVDENLYYIVMELIQGKTLKELIIEERGPLPWKWSINVAMQIAAALDTAHKNNIVHRDIKPHNIIITEDGIAKVTDFGIAKAVSNSTITAFGTTIGSVHYFSPEHARGGYTDAKSDLYSLGVVMYEMMTGRVPFDADTPVSVALKHMQDEPVEPIELNPNILVATNKIIIKLLQKDVNLRYQSASEVLRELKEVLKNPNGADVGEFTYDPTAKTQVIDTDELEEKKNSKSKSKNKKKENKLIRFIKNHKVISSILGLIILFVLSLGITLTVLSVTNPSEVDVPNLVGLSQEEAKEDVEELGLVYEIEKEEYNKDVPEGQIISQSPKFSETYNSVKEGSTIKVTISKGVEKVVTPKVIGEEKEDAIQMLEEAKLVVEVLEETSQDYEEGVVISQSITANEETFAGETIVITVSKGTGIVQVSVPSVITKDEASARKSLEDSKLKVEVVYDEDTNKNNGVVLKQSIDVGQIVDEGTVVIITVNKLQEMKTATVTVNLKSLLGYEIKTDEDGEEIKESAQVKIQVGTDTIYNEKQDKATTNINQTFSDKGNVTVKVYVDDVLKGTQAINLNTETSVIFE